ncbi:MAG: T9SS type A sorting domain-containing protein, partial [Flavobacteriales bacterium]
DQITVNNCTDISDFGSGISEVVIYPNPFTNEISISGNFSGAMQVVILNPIGEMVLSTQLTLNLKLQTSNFSPGIYFLLVKSENTSVIKKIVKE